MDICHHGQIKKLSLPDHWLAKTQSGSADTLRSVSIAYPADRPGVQLRFIWRGSRLPSGAGERFHALLSQPPKELDSEEIQSLAPVIVDLADEEVFCLEKALTLDLSLRRVLQIEGIWKHDPFVSRSYFIDADGTGCLVQEIAFFAPQDEYARYVGTVQEALEAMEWSEQAAAAGPA